MVKWRHLPARAVACCRGLLAGATARSFRRRRRGPRGRGEAGRDAKRSSDRRPPRSGVRAGRHRSAAQPIRADTVHRPSRLASRLLSIAAVLGVASAVVAAVPPIVAAFRAHPYFAVAEIAVSPTQRLSRAAVLDWAGLYEGIGIWNVDLDATARRLEEHPWIARAEVRREPPRRLIVTVTERRPAAIVLLDQPYYVDRRGVAFSPLGPDEPLALPLVTGIEAALVAGEAPYARHAIRQALRVMRTMRAAGLPFRVSEVHIERQEGITVFPVEPRIALGFGWRALPERVARLEEVLGTFGGREAQLRAIDLTAPGEAVIRLRTPAQSGARPRDDAGGKRRTRRET